MSCWNIYGNELVWYHAETSTFEGIGICWLSCWNWRIRGNWNLLDIMLKLTHSRELEFVGYHAENDTFEGIGICWLSCWAGTFEGIGICWISCTNWHIQGNWNLLDIMLKMTHLRELEFVGYHAEAGEFIGTILGKRKHASISDFVMHSFPLID